MNRKNLPLLLMLTAGAAACIITYVLDYSMTARLVSLFIILILFYLTGSILKWTLDFFDRQNEDKKEKDETGDGSETSDEEQKTAEESGKTKDEP